MKAVAICAVLGGGVFVAGLLQLGLFRNQGSPGATTDAAKTEKKTPRAKFPDTLVPAAQAHAVEQAADYKPGPQPHKMVWMTPTGQLHEWHDEIPDAWIADKVEETELVVVV